MERTGDDAARDALRPLFVKNILAVLTKNIVGQHASMFVFGASSGAVLTPEAASRLSGTPRRLRPDDGRPHRDDRSGALSSFMKLPPAWEKLKLVASPVGDGEERGRRTADQHDAPGTRFGWNSGRRRTRTRTRT